ncbi:MAG TPA: hypothetical protein VI911_04905 [Patescibacteria group bacterium]|nr:hypothetical protein [Patescibacteria group bacterium]
MNKKQVKLIESKARKLMKLDGKIWDKYGWQSGNDVNESTYSQEISKVVKPQTLDIIYYYIFEDANFHTLCKGLVQIGAFKKPYGQDNEIYEEYRKLGGKTWQL